MAGFKGRGSKVRVKDSSGTYKMIPGCQDIVMNYPSVGVLDASDQETPSGVIEVMPGEPSEGTLEFTVNFNVQEPTHVLLYNKMRAQTDTSDFQVVIAGPGNMRHSFTGVVRAMPTTLSKNGLQTSAVSIGVGDFGAFEADT